MPNFAVYILFTGLSLFDNRAYVPVAHPVVDVLLMQRPREAASDYYDNAVVPRHMPFLVVDRSVFVGSPPSDFDVEVKVKDDRGVVKATLDVFLLDHTDVEITDFHGANPTPLIFEDARFCLPSTDVCVPKLRSICKKCTGDVDVTTPSVGGTVRLANGVLSVPATEAMRSVWCISDEQKHVGCHVVLPQLVQLMLDSVTVVTLKLTRRDNGHVSLLDIAPSVPGQLLVGSAPVEDVMNLHGTHEIVDHHFEIYYDIMTGKMPRHVPIPRLLRAETMSMTTIEPLFVHSSNCPPAAIR